MWRQRGDGVELLLVHFGGPQWRHRDNGAWGIPKGEVGDGEDVEDCARREFLEETGTEPVGDLVPLGEARYRSGKRIFGFALEGDLDPERITSNHFTLEWPPGSGRSSEWPEVDRAGWFDPETARAKIIPGQRPLIDALETWLKQERPRRARGLSTRPVERDRP